MCAGSRPRRKAGGAAPVGLLRAGPCARQPSECLDEPHLADVGVAEMLFGLLAAYLADLVSPACAAAGDRVAADLRGALARSR
jgi:hypothetical protein